MTRPSQMALRHLFKVLAQQRRDFRPICRWLLLGPEVSRLLPRWEEEAVPPRLDELIDLLRMVDQQAPDLRVVAIWLAAASPLFEGLQPHLQLEELLAAEAGSWSHPVQVLPKPRCPHLELLQACRQRQRSSDDENEAALLAEVETKLARAVAIEERARQRRERRGQDE